MYFWYERPWPLTLAVIILSRTSRHTRTLLWTDLRPALAFPVLWIIVVCLVAWIHQLGALNISNWCVWRAQAWRSCTYTEKFTPISITFLSIVCVCCFSLSVPVTFTFLKNVSDIFIWSSIQISPRCVPVSVCPSSFNSYNLSIEMPF